MRMHNSSYREARDLRLTPSDAKLNKVSRKIRPKENEFMYFEKS